MSSPLPGFAPGNLQTAVLAPNQPLRSGSLIDQLNCITCSPAHLDFDQVQTRNLRSITALSGVI
jgi:hypothetical protein